MRKISKPIIQEQPSYDSSRQWRNNLPCAIQARQSTTKQTIENRESSEAQTKDQLDKVHSIGWSDNLITVFIEGEGKRGVSGRLRIDERPGLNALMEGIYNGTFKTIFTWNESRLFRDEFMIGPDTFIKACYDHDVQVVTYAYRYDFIRNPYDMDQFRTQCQMSARFIKDHIGMMNRMRDRVAERGQYFGGRVPIGYILDENDRFIPYEPHAKVIRWIFRRYKQIGNASQIARELNAKKYAFPPYEAGVRAPYTNLTVKNGGYTITKSAVLGILTNVQYIGYFVFKNQIKRKDGEPVINHPAILTKLREDDGREVDYEELFWYAFNRLSPTTIDGEINEQREVVTRYDQENTVPSKALLKHVIRTYNGTVYISKEIKGTNPEQYSVDFKAPDYVKNHHAARVDVTLIDAAFLEKMFGHLAALQKAAEATKAGETTEEATNVGEAIYEQLQQEKAESKPNGLEVIDGELEQLYPKIAHFDRLVTHGYDLDEEDLVKYTKELKSLRKVEKELKAAREAIGKQEKEKAESEDLLGRTLEEWNEFNLETKRRVVKLVVESVFISRVAPTWLKIEIIWKGIGIPTADTGYLWLNTAANRDWTEEEDAILQEMYPSCQADEILNKLPNRAWKAIIARAYRLKIKRQIFNSSPLNRAALSLSINDLTFMTQYNINVYEARRGFVHWSDTETFLSVLEEDIIDMDEVMTSENLERTSSS